MQSSNPTTVAPANAANKQVTWESSDETVATVDENTGEVTGVAVGSSVITATTSDGNFTAVCLVTVKPGLPSGAINGVFSVSETKQVYFSQGNLWYGKVGDAQTATFQFEDKQYEYHGFDLANDICGYFGWVGASSTVFTSSPEIYGVSSNETNPPYGNVAGESLKADWGTAIEGGTTWRTLTTAEWQYLFSYDGTEGGELPEGTDYSNDIRKDKYKCGVTVCGKANSVVLLPDEWDASVISLEDFATTTGIQRRDYHC